MNHYDLAYNTDMVTPSFVIAWNASYLLYAAVTPTCDHAGAPTAMGNYESAKQNSVRSLRMT